MFGVQLLSGAFKLATWIWKACWYLERNWYQTINYQPEPEPVPAPFLFFQGRPRNISLVRTSAVPFLELEDEPEFRDTLDETILEADAAAWAALFTPPAGADEIMRQIGGTSADAPLLALTDRVRRIQNAYGWEHRGLSDVVVSTMTAPPLMSENLSREAIEDQRDIWLQGQLAIEDRESTAPAGAPTQGLATFVSDLASRLAAQASTSSSSGNQRVPTDETGPSTRRAVEEEFERIV